MIIKPIKNKLFNLLPLFNKINKKVQSKIKKTYKNKFNKNYKNK